VGDPLSGAAPSARTQVRRLPEKQRFARSDLDAILDAARVGHVATSDDAGQPYVLPVAYGRDDERVLLHGSTGSRLFRTLLAGAPTCFTVTVLDGLVLARSAFESSMHYRSAMVLGRCFEVADDDKLAAIQRLTEHLMPGRWPQLRPPTNKELAATTVLALPLDEWSVKVSDGWPDDPPEDVHLPIWAGVLPMRHGFDAPLPAPDLPSGIAPPDYVGGWLA
jgi:nitroimidazol reductase NimA-like FMN-containing flavoprotein (pyridoxamine 5'-phosphate oxidase superfamily)